MRKFLKRFASPLAEIYSLDVEDIVTTSLINLGDEEDEGDIDTEDGSGDDW